MLTEKSKLCHHMERLLRWQEGDLVGPVTIDCALTQKCNLRCVYCYAKLQKNPGTITRKDFSSFLFDAANLDVKGISLISDGESTLRRWWTDAIIEGTDMGIDMAIGTNGILFHKKAAAKLAGRLTYVRFNISAGTPEGYERIHGAPKKVFHRVVRNIGECVQIDGSGTVGMQMVFLPEFLPEVEPLCQLAIKLGVDYLVIKHCSDDEDGSLCVDYKKSKALLPKLQAFENMSTDKTKIFVKSDKISSGNKRTYKKCYGANFIPQISGSGLIAPCGMFFHPKYKKYHLGYLKDGFKKVWQSKKTVEILKHLRSNKFNAQKECGFLCLQHSANIYLNGLANGEEFYVEGAPPPHVNFI